jgi:putative flippase GtrA
VSNDECGQKLSKLFRYLVVGFVGYLFTATLTLTLSKVFKLPEVLVYGFSLFVLYFADYLLNLKFVFKAAHQNKKFVTYAIYLGFSGLTGTWIFALVFDQLGQIFISNAITLIILLPVRYMVSRHILTIK